MFLKLIRTATVTCCFLSIPSPGSLGQSISKQAAALLCGCSFSLFFHHKQKDSHLSMSAHSACTQVYMVALGSGLDSLMFHTASLLSHIFLQAQSAINDFFFFLPTGQMEQIGLSMSTTCLGELQKLLAAWQTPRLWAWQRKPLRHSQRALSTSGEHPKHHNLSEQTALLFISPHLLWGSGMRKGESVNRNGMQHSMQYLFGIVCGSKKFGIWEENFLDRVKHSSVLYSYF